MESIRRGKFDGQFLSLKGGNLFAVLMRPPQTKLRRVVRRCLIGLGVVLVLIGLFYAEEDWRGERAWKNCKKYLEAQGVKLDRADYIPAPVPEEQNVFGVPEMQKWFGASAEPLGLAWQWTELSKNLSYPGYAEGSRNMRA